MGRSIQLGKIFGIPFLLDYSWFIIFALVTVLLATSIFPLEWSEAARWGIGLATSILFFASVLAHELAHSLVSLRAGIPVKSITLFLFGGVAQITKEAPSPKTELVMAAAGPLCSLALGGIFYGLFWAFNGVNEYLAGLTLWLSYINVVLAIFNMIPGFPLDGGRVLRAIIWMVSGDYMKASRIAIKAGFTVSYIFMIGGVFMAILTENLFNGIWLVIIGLFLNGANRSTQQQTILRESMKGASAQDVMTKGLSSVPRQLAIEELARGPMLTAPSQCFLVTDGGRAVGALTLRQLKAVPKDQWGLTTAGQVMTPFEELKAVRPTDDILPILEGMDSENLEMVSVVGEGKLVGIILRDDLMRYAQRLRDLKA